MEILKVFVMLMFFGVLFAIAISDIHTRKIPNRLIVMIAGLGLISVLIFPEIPLIDRMTCIFCVSGPLLLLNRIASKSFGGGDIKLTAATGLFLGWRLNLMAFILALFIAAVYGIWLMVVKGKGRKTKFPFGPFLCFGIIIVWLWGEHILMLVTRL